MEHQSINKLLSNHRVTGVYHSHVSMGKIKGCYNFTRQDEEVFWKTYTQTMKEEPDSVYGIAEKPRNYLPILVDVDIKLRETEETEYDDQIHTDKHVKEVIEVYQSVLRKIVDNCTDEKLICILLEKPLYRINKNGISYVKHGFHLHFPYCFLHKDNHIVHLLPRVKDELNKLKTFNDIGIEDSGSVIDGSYCNNPWLLYGSRKESHMKPYIVSKVFNSDGVVTELEKALKKYQIYDMKEKLINIAGKVEEYLPRILSIIPNGREESEIKFGIVSPLKQQIKNKNKQKRKEYKTKTITENIEIAKKLIPMLSDFRSDDRNEWMTVGWVLYSIGDGCSDAFDLWSQFSSKCEDKYVEAECISKWQTMKKQDITIGTLRYYASIDSPEEYRKFKTEQSIKHVQSSLDGSHNDIAKLLYSEYSDEFVCVSITSKSWFQYIGSKWEMVEDGTSLRQKISGEIVDRYLDMRKEIFTQLADSTSTDKRGDEMLHSKLKKVQKIIGNLKSAPYKNNVMKECMEVFYDKRFRDKLDTNPHLFPFNNGIYDLKVNIFRHGRPEDFISKSSPIDYVEMGYDDKSVHDVFDYLEKVFPDKSVRDYFMDVSSDVFLGGNHLKHVYFWTGEGDNAKSVTQNIFEAMLGPLSIKFNTTIITGKKVSSGAANPELARAGGGVRLATLEEPNSDETINIGILKNLTGNDKFYARDLFEKGKEGREITPMFKLVFICNKLPKLKYSDKAVWNRIRVIPFESTFCKPSDPAPDTYEEQLKQKRFPMDKNFGEKIPGMLQAFAWMLIKHRQKVKDRTLEPSKVRQYTEDYQKQNDIYRQFIDENISTDKTKIMYLTELYAQFKDWFRESNPNGVMPIKNEVEEQFTKIWGEPLAGKKWRGYRIKTLSNHIEDGDALRLGEEDLVDYNLPEM